jgi:hypothetical protein
MAAITGVEKEQERASSLAMAKEDALFNIKQNII